MSQVTLEFLDQIGSSLKLKAVRVDLPEWGKDVFAYVGEMNANERDERIETYWQARKERIGQENNVGFRAHLVAAAMCDENRNWLAQTAEDIDKLAAKVARPGVAPVQRMFATAHKLNAMSVEEIEELEKN